VKQARNQQKQQGGQGGQQQGGGGQKPGQQRRQPIEKPGWIPEGEQEGGAEKRGWRPGFVCLTKQLDETISCSAPGNGASFWSAPQSSSASRFTAGALGFLTLNPMRRPPPAIH